MDVYNLDDVKSYSIDYDITPEDLSAINSHMKKCRRRYDKSFFHELLKNHPKALKKDAIIMNKYKLISKLGSGSNGKVWLVEKISDNTPLALKFGNKLLLAEYTVLKDLIDIKGVNKVVDECGFDTLRNLYYLPLEKLESSLDMYYKSRNKTVSESSIKIFGSKLLKILRDIHNKNYIYRDLSFKNIMMDKEGYIHLIDFGLSFILDKEECIKYSGTYMFSSSSALKGNVPNFWDDIESVFYILVHLYFGAKGVPWEYCFKTPRVYITDYISFAKVRDDYLFEHGVLNKLPSYLSNFYKSINREKKIDYDVLISHFNK